MRLECNAVLLKISLIKVCLNKVSRIHHTEACDALQSTYDAFGRLLMFGEPYDANNLTFYKYMIMSRRMGKPTICIGENKGADQLRSNCEADQHLYSRYSHSTVSSPT